MAGRRPLAALAGVALLVASHAAWAQLDRVEAAWNDLVFTRAGFDEVVLLADEFHVLPKMPARAWTSAAAGLYKTLDPPLELLPKAYLDAERARPDAEGTLDGEVSELGVCGPLGLVLLRRAKPAKGPADAAELRAQRQHRKEQAQRLQQAWQAVEFAKTQFDCLAADAVRRLDAQPADPAPLPAGASGTNDDPRVARTSRLWRVASSHFLQGLDAHGSLMPTALFTALESEASKTTSVDVGLVLAKDGAAVTVLRVERDGPAAKAGLRKGWAILRIDGKEVAGLDVAALHGMLEGKPGSKLAIVAQHGADAPKTVKLVRRQFERSTVVGSAVGEGTGVGVIKLDAFGSGAADGVRGALKDVQLETGELPKALVLDMRGNGGGWVKQGIAVADVFLGDGVVATQHNRKPPPKVFESKTAPDDLKQPLVVLVDAECKSACEMVSSALQDRDRAVVLGQRTFGKGSVQAVIDATVGKWSVLLTIATYRGPLGRSLQNLGVQPDVELPVPENTVQSSLREADFPSALPADQAVAPHRSKLAADAVKSCAAARAAQPSEWRTKLGRKDPWLLAASDWAACLIAR